MNKNIIQYITFKNNEDFVDWQKLNAVTIINIAPIPVEVSVDMYPGQQGCSGGIEMNIFVTYIETP